MPKGQCGRTPLPKPREYENLRLTVKQTLKRRWADTMSTTLPPKFDTNSTETLSSDRKITDFFKYSLKKFYALKRKNFSTANPRPSKLISKKKVTRPKFKTQDQKKNQTYESMIHEMSNLNIKSRSNPKNRYSLLVNGQNFIRPKKDMNFDCKKKNLMKANNSSMVNIFRLSFFLIEKRCFLKTWGLTIFWRNFAGWIWRRKSSIRPIGPVWCLTGLAGVMGMEMAWAWLPLRPPLRVRARQSWMRILGNLWGTAARAAAVRVSSATIFSIRTSVLGRGATSTPRGLFWITIRWSLNKLGGGQYKEIITLEGTSNF